LGSRKGWRGHSDPITFASPLITTQTATTECRTVPSAAHSGRSQSIAGRECRAQRTTDKGCSIQKPDRGATRGRGEQQVVGRAIRIKVRGALQRPTCRQSRSERTRLEGGSIQEPNRCLTRARIEEEIIRFVVGIEIKRVDEYPT